MVHSEVTEFSAICCILEERGCSGRTESDFAFSPEVPNGSQRGGLYPARSFKAEGVPKLFSVKTKKGGKKVRGQKVQLLSSLDFPNSGRP